MDWAYFNFGPKLIFGIKSSPKSKSIQLIKSIKWAKGKMVISPFEPPCRLHHKCQSHFGNILQVFEGYKRRGRVRKLVEIQKP